MHTLFFSPRVLRTDSSSWGSDVISTVNSSLDMDMEYTPPKDADSNHLQSTSRQDGSRGRTADREHCTPLPRTQCHEHLHRRTAEQLRTPQKDTDPFYKHHEPSAYALRLPDFIKRVFAPPNCLTPEASPRKDLNHHLLFDRMRHKAVLDQAVFGTRPKRDHVRIKSQDLRLPRLLSPEHTRFDIPWLSTDTEGHALRTPRTQTRPWSGMMKWSSNSKILSTQGVPSIEPDLERSKSMYSTIPYTSESFQAKNATSLDSLQRALQMEQDVQAFLDSAQPPNPLTAREITLICEQGGGISSASSTDLSVSDLSQATSDRSRLSLFQPRQTIGKLKKTRKRRSLTVDTIEA